MSFKLHNMATFEVVDDETPFDPNKTYAPLKVFPTIWKPQRSKDDSREAKASMLLATAVDDTDWPGYPTFVPEIPKNMTLDQCKSLYSKFIQNQFQQQDSHECDILLHDAQRRAIYIRTALEAMTPPHMLSEIYASWHVLNLNTPVPLCDRDKNIVDGYKKDPVEFRRLCSGEAGTRPKMVFRELMQPGNINMSRSRHMNCPCINESLKRMVLPLLTQYDKVRFTHSHI